VSVFSFSRCDVRHSSTRQVSIDSRRRMAGRRCQFCGSVSSWAPMAGPRLKTVTRTQGNNQVLKSGAVKPRAFEFEFEEVSPLIDAFRRMVRGLEFDACEMAITTYICARSYGKRFTALPIFLVRAFHHGAILHNTKTGIRSPKDLEGKKVGVNRGYTVTTGLWARSILQHQYGVDLSTITWVLSGDEHVVEYQPPANVVSLQKGKKMGDMLASGELVAAVGLEADHPDVRPLIPNARAVAVDIPSKSRDACAKQRTDEATQPVSLRCSPHPDCDRGPNTVRAAL